MKGAPSFVLVVGSLGHVLHPVRVLSRGPKFARVRWLHAGYGARWHKRSETERVPSFALCGPLTGAWFSVGRRRVSRPSWRHYRVWVRDYLLGLGPDFYRAYQPKPKRVRP